MIRAAAWFSPGGCGLLRPDGRGQRRPAPDVAAPDAIAPVIGRLPKYYSRMTVEARYALSAASLALRAADWRGGGELAIGILAAGFEGWLDAGAAYFDDYVRFGRSTARSALFIYTLPTSVSGELSIALELRGPALHWHADQQPVAALVARAERMTVEGQADGMLALWSDPHAATCLAIGPGPAATSAAPWPANLDLPPQDLARALAASVRTEC